MSHVAHLVSLPNLSPSDPSLPRQAGYLNKIPNSALLSSPVEGRGQRGGCGRGRRADMTSTMSAAAAHSCHMGECRTLALLFATAYMQYTICSWTCLQELGSNSARVLINQSVRACDLGKLLLLGVLRRL